MDPVSTPKKSTSEKPTKKKTSLGKRKKQPSEGNPGSLDDLDSVGMSESRKKVQKVTHSNTVNQLQKVN